jgi:hypothetical protein
MQQKNHRFNKFPKLLRYKLTNGCPTTRMSYNSCTKNTICVKRLVQNSGSKTVLEFDIRGSFDVERMKSFQVTVKLLFENTPPTCN